MNLDCTDEEANSVSANPDIFLNGRGVVYDSLATNLIDPAQDQLDQSDTNGLQDVFESRLKPEFRRGDANGEGNVEIADSVFIYNYLFSNGLRPECMDAADANNSGGLNLSDVQYITNFLFQGGPAPPPPFPGCGFDPTDDCLSCKKRGSVGTTPCADDHSHD
jgi:hypothetical protein